MHCSPYCLNVFGKLIFCDNIISLFYKKIKELCKKVRKSCVFDKGPSFTDTTEKKE